MRKETRKYICAELLNYQRSRKELNRIKEKTGGNKTVSGIRRGILHG
mgnify:CR=1 FL=1